MNISKLLKITALSCIGLFSINNSIVNAVDGIDINDLASGFDAININDPEDGMDIDDDDINDLTSRFNAININKTAEVIKQIINNNRAMLDREAMNLSCFNNIVLSDGHIIFYFNNKRFLVFSDKTYDDTAIMDLSRVYYVLQGKKTIQGILETLIDYMENNNFRAYQANTDDTGRIVSLTEL